jgi:hypothetical protein
MPKTELKSSNSRAQSTLTRETQVSDKVKQVAIRLWLRELRVIVRNKFTL